MLGIRACRAARRVDSAWAWAGEQISSRCHLRSALKHLYSSLQNSFPTEITTPKYGMPRPLFSLTWHMQSNSPTARLSIGAVSIHAAGRRRKIS